jgi:hypothetical protein
VEIQPLPLPIPKKKPYLIFHLPKKCDQIFPNFSHDQVANRTREKRCHKAHTRVITHGTASWEAAQLQEDNSRVPSFDSDYPADIFLTQAYNDQRDTLGWEQLLHHG